MNNEDGKYFQSCITVVLRHDQGTVLLCFVWHFDFFEVEGFFLKNGSVKSKQDWTGVRRSGSSTPSFANCIGLNFLESFKSFRVSSKTCQRKCY